MSGDDPQLWSRPRRERHAELYEAEYAKQVERIARIRNSVSAGLPDAPPAQPPRPPEGPSWDSRPADLAPPPRSVRHAAAGARRVIEPRVREERRRPLARWIAAALLAAAVAAIVLMRGHHPLTFRLPGRATGLAVADGRIWVAAPDTGAVWQLDARTGRPAGPPERVGDTPARLALAGHGVWVADTGRSAVVRVPGSAAPIPAGPDIADIAYAAGTVWTASAADGTVRAIDPRPRVRIVTGGTHLVALAGDARRVVAADAGGTLVRIDARARRLAGPPIVLGGMPVAVALSGDSAWVADAAAGTVRRVDLAAGRPAGAPVHVGAAPVAVVAAGREVFVLCRGDRTLVRIDAASGRVQARVPVPGDPTAIAVDARHAWVAAGGDEVIRVDS